MVRILSVGLIVTTVLLVVWGVLTGYDELLSVGRMWETPAIKPHEAPIPVMTAGSVISIADARLLKRKTARS